VKSIVRAMRSLVATWRSKSCLLHFVENIDRLNRFEQEAQAAGALNHPNMQGIKTPKREIDLVKDCLKRLREMLR